jgi:hypothetical protein
MCKYSSSLTHKLSRYSSFRQDSQENAYPQSNRFSSFRIQPKLIYDETWLSNKQYNARVDKISSKRKASRTSTYQESNGQIIHERVYPGVVMKSKLCLRIAVNGASKSMRGQLPLANLNLINGDFGDDAGMIVDNRDYSFVG